MPLKTLVARTTAVLLAGGFAAATVIALEPAGPAGAVAIAPQVTTVAGTGTVSGTVSNVSGADVSGEVVSLVDFHHWYGGGHRDDGRQRDIHHVRGRTRDLLRAVQRQRRVPGPVLGRWPGSQRLDLRDSHERHLRHWRQRDASGVELSRHHPDRDRSANHRHDRYPGHHNRPGGALRYGHDSSEDHHHPGQDSHGDQDRHHPRKTTTKTTTAGSTTAPSVASGSLGGIGAKQVALKFKVDAGANTGGLKSFEVTLPKGFSFVSKKLKTGVKLGKLNFTYKLTGDALTVTLKSAQKTFNASFGGGAITTTSVIAKNAKAQKIASEKIFAHGDRRQGHEDRGPLRDREAELGARHGLRGTTLGCGDRRRLHGRRHRGVRRAGRVAGRSA